MDSNPIADAMNDDEHRHFHRRKFRGKLEIEWGSATLTGTVRDIGPRGLFVELDPPLWVGAAFRARLMITPVLQLDCIVRRVEPGGGIAIAFDMPDEGGKAQLDALLATLPEL
jgi:hypothetical protein